MATPSFIPPRNLTCPADATRTQVRLPQSRPERPVLEHHETYLTQGPTPQQQEVYRRQDLERARQDNLNKICQSDPVASMINGHYQIGNDWHQVGPTVLEGVAAMTPLPRVVTAAVAGINTYKAIKDPNATNVISAGLGIAATGVGVRGRMLEQAAQKGTVSHRALEAFERHGALPVETAEGAFKGFEITHRLAERNETGHQPHDR